LESDDAFLEFGLLALREFAEAHSDRTVIADLGAGFQCAPSAQHLCKTFQVIAIMASPAIAHERFVRHRHPRELPEFMSTEFNEHRVNVYQSAQHTIDTDNMTAEQTTCAALELVQGLLST